MRESSRFASDGVNADLFNVDWNALLVNEPGAESILFLLEQNIFKNKLVNKHATHNF